jgi:hypothetical protein
MIGRREKIFGPGPGSAVPLDRNAKARIAAYTARLDGQEPPPRPSWPAVGLPQQPDRLLLPELRGESAKAECARSTVAEALRVLEWR